MLSSNSLTLLDIKARLQQIPTASEASRSGSRNGDPVLMHMAGVITREVECVAAEEVLKTVGVVKGVAVSPKTGEAGLLPGVEVEIWHQEDGASLSLRKAESKICLKRSLC